MSLLDRLYPVIRPLVFQLDAEAAHDATIKMLSLMDRLGVMSSDIARSKKPIKLFGLKFPNAVGLAAGLDKSASAVDAWSALGFGFVEVGTLTPRPQPGNPQPRLFRLVDHGAIINRMGFNNPGIHAAVERLEKRQGPGIVGVNIGKNFDTPNEEAVGDYLKCLRAAYATADYIAVNISSPNTKGLRDLQAEGPIRQLISELKEEQDKLKTIHGKHTPILVKIAPDLSPEQIESMARVFTDCKLEGVIATNTTLSREAVAGHELAHEAGGLSGLPVREKSTEVIKALRQALPSSIPMIGVGGIFKGSDAVDKMKAGASLVQLYSGLIYRGPALVRECFEAIEQA